MKNRWLYIALPLFILAVALAGGFTLLWRFFVFVAVLLLLSYLWMRLGSRGIGGGVEKTPDCCRVGEYFEEEFTVTRLSRVPAPLIEVSEETDLPGYRNSVSFSLASPGPFRWRTRAYCRRRGSYRVGALNVKVTDPLGFFSSYQRIGEHRGVIVFPAALELPFFQVLPHQQPGESPRRWLVSELGPGVSRVREYTSGDSLRRIHWPTTAHTGRLVVKEFDPDRPSYTFKNIWLVLDIHRASRFGEGDDSTEEYGITIAASLAAKYIESGKRVGLIASGDRPCLVLPGTGDEHLQNILRSLALMKATGSIPIDELLASQAERFEAGAAVIVIMPSQDRAVAPPLRQAINRGLIANAILLDSRSFGGGTGASFNARQLASGGFRVYVVRRGQDIAAALDSRVFSLNLPLTGEKIFNG
jgi:uncharacterized protein (DUF58 family)